MGDGAYRVAVPSSLVRVAFEHGNGRSVKPMEKTRQHVVDEAHTIALEEWVVRIALRTEAVNRNTRIGEFKRSSQHLFLGAIVVRR